MALRLVMHRELATVPADWAKAAGPAGVTFEGPGRTAAELVPAFVAAYPPGHPDHEAGWDPEAEEARILAGAECGPLRACTRFAVAEGAVVGAVLMTGADGSHHVGECALVADAFRHPAWPGLGRVLLRRAIGAAAAEGHARAGLLVAAENERAQRVYAALGFTVTSRFERPA